MERQWRNPSDVMKTRSIRKKKVRPHTCWLCSLIVLARVKITLSSCVQLQRASSLGGLNKENSPLKSVNRSVNESGAVRKRTAGIALGEQENCPSALTATRTKNSSLCSPSTKVHWPNTANYSLHDAPQVSVVFYCQNIFSLVHIHHILICLQKFRSSCLSEVSFNVHRNIEKVTTVCVFSDLS